MFTNPNVASDLAREHHRQMLAQASQRQLARLQGQPTAARNRDLAVRTTRRLAAAIGRAGVVAAEKTGAIWPARPRPFDPAAQAQTPVRSH